MGVKLRKKKNSSGRQSLFLDIHSGGRRWKEYLNLTLEPGRSPQVTAINSNTMDMAKGMRNNRENELLASQGGIKQPHKLRNVRFLDYFEKVKKNYPNKDLRLVEACYSYYTKFARQYGYDELRISDVNKTICEDFLTYIKQFIRGETILNYFTKFKYVLLKAVKDGIITASPAEGIKATRDGGIKKEILSLDEIRLMAANPCSNDEVKRAFLFSCFTGLRWVDVKKLKYGQFDFNNGYIRITQKKTESSSGNASLTIPITETVKKLVPGNLPLGTNDLVFNLPSHSYANRHVKAWAKAAGITKSLSWHCSRHSYAVILLTTGKADIKTAASLLGHSGLKHFEKYTRAVDELRVQAANKIEL